MITIDYLNGLDNFLPTYHCEEDLNAEEVKVLDFIKRHVGESGRSIPLGKIIREFGKYNRIMDTQTWHCTPLKEMMDRGAVAAVKFNTPAFIQ
ncbi:hypothetical protein AB6T85_21775 [Erwinia sp. ACCC 02193]|jgi:hypothetical protein|uniref:Uncharacterized protein n=1 Tax=Erwinia aeris TaxID=3239803 RepID=A0ABV4EE85_9GAMM